MALSNGLYASIASTHAAQGGSTFMPWLGDCAGKDFVAVSIFPERSEVVTDAPTAESIEAFFEANADLLDDDSRVCGVGTWYDSAAGKHYLDVVGLVSNRDKAEALGRLFNQVAVFDLTSFEEIPTGGDGTAPADLLPVKLRFALLR